MDNGKYTAEDISKFLKNLELSGEIEGSKKEVLNKIENAFQAYFDSQNNDNSELSSPRSNKLLIVENDSVVLLPLDPEIVKRTAERIKSMQPSV